MIKKIQQTKGKSMKVFIDGKETSLNALDFLKFALDVRSGRREPLGEIEN
jgi:hypothetical protein